MTDGAVAAGSFTVWLGTIGPALRGEGESDVPCGTCTGCCTSSQFVLVTPSDTAARSVIPAELLFPAPFLPGSHLLPYDERGRCPMLGERGCTIYAERPMTCRTYDCRVFPAAGVPADKPAVAERAGRWEFDHPSAADVAAHDAVRAAGRWLAAHAGLLPEDVRPPHPTALAVLAVQVHEVFLAAAPPADADVVAAAVAARASRT
ncbi:YkgJ family cysteine cluster protein [Longivirga aurantiaca]|uniref:YkgJ family cysteine cluster protein n=1 Tax=Longivirga aurantiaca TaxID=1837743 RepID=A0ABW1T0Z7_9ACTN